MKKENIIKLLAFSGLFASYAANAACPPPAGTLPPYTAPSIVKDTSASAPKIHPTKHYWRQCWASVESHAFSGSALDDMDSLKRTFQEDYQALIMAQNKANTTSLLDAQNINDVAMAEAITQLYASEKQSEVALRKQLIEIKMQHKRDITDAAMNSKYNGYFDDDNGKNGIVQTGTQSYTFFKSMCKRNKMFSKITSPEYKSEKSIAMNKAITKQTAKMAEQTGNTNELAMEKMTKQNSVYCSATDIKYEFCTNPDLKLCKDGDVSSGVCSVSEDEVMDTPNLSTSAENLLNPEGFNGRYAYDGTELEEPKNEIEDELFRIEYTYTPEQEAAAREFASHIVSQAGVKAPTAKEKEMPSKQKYVSQYNSYLAQVNMSAASFENAIQMRIPITEGEIKMSELDIIHYIIHNLSDPDQSAAAFGGKSRTPATLEYQLRTMNNKLLLLSLEQQERIEALRAIRVIQKENAPDKVNDLNRIR
tara:strand:- start:37461 stop:38891 length:1431 start_codon:yes stop_codon:yes gene_type:complete